MRGPATPLLDRAAGEPLLLDERGVVTAGAFLAAARGVAAGLGDGDHVVNACRGRYAFAVAFAAGLMAGRTALLNVEGARMAGFGPCRVLEDADVLTASPVDGPVPLVPDAHLAAIVFTSGSTGAPTPHRKSWGGLVARSRAAGAAFGLGDAGGIGTVVGTVPPQHMYGFETTVLLPLHVRVASWCGPAFFPADVAAALKACPGPRTLVTTPLQLRALLGSRLAMAAEAVVSATAPLEEGLARDVEAAWGAPVREIFGATECGSIAWRRTVAGPVWTAYPGVRVAADGLGTVVSAPGMADVGLSDELEAAPGGFRLLGRRTDVVKLGGRRASLPGLNQVLASVPGVDDGAFVVPEDLDARSTARLVAVVAPGRTHGAITDQEILAALREVLDPVFLPRRVIRVERLPRNALGKLPRQALLDLVAGSA